LYYIGLNPYGGHNEGIKAYDGYCYYIFVPNKK